MLDLCQFGYGSQGKYFKLPRTDLVKTMAKTHHVLLGWLFLFVAAWAGAAESPSAASAPLTAVKSAILAATGYDAASVEIATNGASVIVTVVNSKLAETAQSAAREEEARKIVRAIADSTVDKPEFTGLHAIHIDYVKRESGGTGSHVIDSIDYLKNPRGIFEHHIT